MSGEAQLVVGVTVTGLGLLVAWAGWLLVRRQLRVGPSTPVTVVAKYTTPATWWRQPEHEYAWNQVNDYWVSVLQGSVDEASAVAYAQDASARSRLVSVRVPGRVFRRAQPGTWLDFVTTKAGLVHPYYRVRWLIWSFGGIAAVLVVNGVSLFIVEDAYMPSWLQ